MLAAATLAVVSCGDDDSTKPDDDNGTWEPGPALSPEEALENLQASYRGKNIEAYRAVLNANFIFKPSPFDDDLDFEQLNRLEDIASTETMFESVRRIDIDLTYSESRQSGFTEEYPPEQGYREIQVSNVFLAVYTRRTENGEPVTILVDGDEQTFVFSPDSSVTPVTWTIVYQRDDHVEALDRPLTEESSWGQIKAFFVQEHPATSQALSPEAALDSLQSSYRRMDIDAYDAVIDDDLVFIPSEYDVLGFLQLNQFEDHLSTENMFDHANLIDIELSHVGSRPSTYTVQYPPEEGYREIRVSNVFLLVYARWMDSGEPVAFLIDGDEQTFVFRPDSTVTPVTWTIIYQRDDHIGFAGRTKVFDMSWGNLKDLYR
jgi:hypothetical protein